jgi:rhodanese-related sulfurtransferase
MNLDTEFLLLDLREHEEYEEYHIKEALSYPGPNIKRDKPIAELYHYKNRENKIVIVYHFDERMGI